MQVTNSSASMNFDEPPGSSDVHPQTELPMTVNMLGGRADGHPEEKKKNWNDIKELLMQSDLHHGDRVLAEYIHSDSDIKKQEKDCPAWMPVSLKEQSQGRKSENIDQVFCIVLDCDNGVTLVEAKELLHGRECIIHTTYSHTPEAPKFRVVLPLKQPVTPLQAKAHFFQMHRLFGERLDKACMEATRLFYLPSCPPDALAYVKRIHMEGSFLDIADLSAEDRMKVVADNPTVESTPGTARLTAVVARGASVGQRNTALTEFVGNCIAKDMTNVETLDHAAKWNAELTEPLSDFEVRRTVDSVFKTAERKRALSQMELVQTVETMNREYAFLTNSARIVRLHDRSVQPKDSMRIRYANTAVINGDTNSNKKVTHYDAWLNSPERREHIDFTFQPGQDIIFDNHVNLWMGWGAAPVKGDVSLWTELLDHLFGASSPERKWFEQWIAYPLQYPGTKLSTAAVIWSRKQGVGKSLIGETISSIYGRHGKTITAAELHSTYNGWAEDALFVLGEENSSGDHRADSNKLKHLITGTDMFIQEKYVVAHQAANVMNFLFTSNHPDAFHLETNDRRYFVWSIDVAAKSGDFYDRYTDWKDSKVGINALMDHLLTLDLSGFEAKGPAPLTAAKTSMRANSATELERWVADVLSDEYIDKHLGAEITSLNDLLSRFHGGEGSSRSNVSALSKALGRECEYKSARISIGGTSRIMAISLRNHEHWELADKSAWVAEYLKGKRKAAADRVKV